MTGMKDYLLWLQQQQTQKPEWQAARQWQNRNQTPIKNTQEKSKDSQEDSQEINDIPTEE